VKKGERKKSWGEKRKELKRRRKKGIRGKRRGRRQFHSVCSRTDGKKAIRGGEKRGRSAGESQNVRKKGRNGIGGRRVASLYPCAGEFGIISGGLRIRNRKKNEKKRKGAEQGLRTLF